MNWIDPLGLAGAPLALTDVRRLAQTANALETQRAGVRFRSFTRANGRPMVAVSGRGGVFPVAPGAYGLDNAAVAQYLNPTSAARSATWSWNGGLTVLLVTTQDIVEQVTSGGSLTDPAFFGQTTVDVVEGLAAGAVGATFGAVATAGTWNPALGIATNVVFSKLTSLGLDALEQWAKDRLSTGSRE